MGTDDQSLLDAIRITLAEIAETASPAPPWLGAWNRLGPESSERDRLAVYQAVRRAGALPSDAGFALIAWQVEVITNEEADVRLKDLDDRIAAIEQAYAWETGEPGPDDEAPPEYDQLRQQYQDAWVNIYVANLELLDGPEMAEQYRTDLDEFSRRYGAGLQYFEETSRLVGRVSPDDPVRLTSCWDVPHADIVRIVLAEEQIQAAFGNAAFLGWLWQYGNADHGVTVYVRRRQVEQAREALAAARARYGDHPSAWTCPACGTRISGQWDACWQCGRWADREPAPPAENAPPQARAGEPPAIFWNVPRLFGAIVGLLAVFLLIKHGPGPALAVGAIAALLVFLMWQFEPSPHDEPAQAVDVNERPPHDFRRTRSAVSRATVQRAWQAAVIGFFSFPPLGFYSMRLLWKLGRRETPLSHADNWRTWLAFFLNILAILYCFVFVVAMAACFGGF
jgi:hypothetical protein